MKEPWRNVRGRLAAWPAPWLLAFPALSASAFAAAGGLAVVNLWIALGVGAIGVLALIGEKTMQAGLSEVASSREAELRRELEQAHKLTRRARTEGFVAIDDTLDQFIRLMSEMAEHRHTSDLRSTVRAAEVHAGAAALKMANGHPTDQHHRVVLFRITESAQGRRQKLRVVDHFGRQVSPHEIVQTNATGEATFAALERVAALYVPSTQDPSASIWNSQRRDYACFFAAPIHANGKTYGLLSIDSLQVDDFDTVTQSMIVLLAKMLGFIYELSNNLEQQILLGSRGVGEKS